MLINVTGFFRDPDAWETLKTEILPQILERKRNGAPIRVWSAGCSTGEEAYRLVMVLAEMLGWEEFRARVKIYATDMDEPALAEARSASYGEKSIETIPPHLLKRYFEQVGGRYVFRPELRRCAIFGRNNLALDAPISHLDLRVRRNTLMYFNADAQNRILARFHFALNPGGILFLGRAEMLLTRSSVFTPVDLPSRIFTKVPKTSLRERLMLASEGEVRTANENKEVEPHGKLPLHEAALDAVPVAHESLEAAYEELHSTSEELETTNEELRRRTDELNRVSGYMASILASMQTGVVVLDNDLRVQLWSDRVEELWGVRPGEAEGEAFFELDIGLPLDRLRGPVRGCLDGKQSEEIVVEAANRRGRAFQCRVSCAQLLDAKTELQGIIILMEEWQIPERAP